VGFLWPSNELPVTWTLVSLSAFSQALRTTLHPLTALLTEIQQVRGEEVAGSHSKDKGKEANEAIEILYAIWKTAHLKKASWDKANGTDLLDIIIAAKVRHCNVGSVFHAKLSYIAITVPSNNWVNAVTSLAGMILA